MVSKYTHPVIDTFPSLTKLVRVPAGEDVARRILPFDVYRSIRDDMVDIYVSAYFVYPPATEAFSNVPISELQDKAGKNAVAAMNYDPSAAITEIQQQINRLTSWIGRTLVLIFLFSVATGMSFLVAWSRGAIQVFATVTGTIFSAITSGSLLLGTIAAIVFTYAWMLPFSSTVVEIMNEELVYGPRNYKTRSHSRLVGYTIWNSSLEGSGAIKLLLVFSTLKVLSVIPGCDPYTSIKRKVQRNMDIFVDADGFIDAVRMGFSRLREQQRERRREEREYQKSMNRDFRSR